MDIQLKPEFAEFAIGYNGSAKPLGQRKDLDKLIVIAHRAGRQDYLDMFDNPPALNDLLGEAADEKLAAISAPYKAPEVYPTSPATPLAPENLPPADQTPTREVDAPAETVESLAASVLDDQALASTEPVTTEAQEPAPAAETTPAIEVPATEAAAVTPAPPKTSRKS